MLDDSYDNQMLLWSYPRRAPKYSFALSRDRISIPAYMDESVLDDPEFWKLMKWAFRIQRKVFGVGCEKPKSKRFDYWRRHNPPFRFQLLQGLFDDDGYEIEGSDPIGHRTIRILDNWYTEHVNSRPFATHWVDLKWHQQIVKEAVQKGRADIESIVCEQVKLGVARGIKDSNASLRKVENERRQIEEQIARLEREKANVEAAERRLLERRKAREQGQAEGETQSQQFRTRDGYVYVIHGLHDKTVFKIGRTNNPDRRVSQFNVKLPYPVELDILIKTENMYSLESRLHAHFASKRLDGEWFRLTEDDIDYLRKIEATGEDES